MHQSLNRLYLNISNDLKYIHAIYGILTNKQLEMLTRDIQYVFMDNIAKEIKLCFYDPDNKKKIYSQYIYTNKGESIIKGNLDINKTSDKLAFDVFIEFTDTFQKIDKQLREILLNNTELDWFS